MSNDTEKEELIGMLGIHLQNQHSISPLSSRIWATLIMEGKEKGLTFEYLVDKLQASKSSISTSLNLLLKTDKIYYSTLSGDRKKYFRPYPFSERFERLIKNLEFEKKLLDKIISYKSKEEYSIDNNCGLENIKAYKEHLHEMEKITQNLLTDLQNIEQKNINLKQ